MAKPLIIELTAMQRLQLTPLFEKCRTENRAGSPGMLVAQPIRDDVTGECYMRVGFLPHDKALLLTEQAYGLPDEGPIPPGVGE